MQDGEEDAVRLSQFGQLIRFRMLICRRNASSSFNYASRRYLPCTVPVQSEPRFRIMSSCSEHGPSVHQCSCQLRCRAASIVPVARHHEVNLINFAGLVRFYCQGLLVILNPDCQFDCSSLFSDFRLGDSHGAANFCFVEVRSVGILPFHSVREAGI